MESTVQVQSGETAPVWTEEKHINFLNTMEAYFVRTMLHRSAGGSAFHLRLDRHLPDSSESTLDSKPRGAPSKRAPSDHKMGPRSRMESRRITRRRRRSSQLRKYSMEEEQVVPQLENGREGAAAFVGDDDQTTTDH